MFPGVGCFWVFEDTAEVADCIEGCGEAAVIVTEGFADFLAWCTGPVSAPSFAGRVGYDGVRASVGSGIPGFVPGVDVWEVEVAPTCFYEQGCDHGSGSGCGFGLVLGLGGLGGIGLCLLVFIVGVLGFLECVWDFGGEDEDVVDTVLEAGECVAVCDA